MANDKTNKKNKIDIKHLPVGIYSDGTPTLVNLNSGNMMCQGEPGSGKSVFLSALLCSLMRCEPYQPEIAILSPKSLDFQNFQGAATIIGDPEEMLAYLKYVRELGNKRKQVCLDRGIKKIGEDLWEQYPPIVTLIDEYAVVFGSEVMDEKTGRAKRIGGEIDSMMNNLVAEMRFAAIVNCLTTQRFSTTNINATLRENISGTLVSFATNGATTDSMIWKDQTEDAPCFKIRKSQTGCGYIGIGGAKPRAFKGAFANDEDEKAAAEFYRARRLERDPNWDPDRWKDLSGFNAEKAAEEGGEFGGFDFNDFNAQRAENAASKKRTGGGIPRSKDAGASKASKASKAAKASGAATARRPGGFAGKR